MIQTQFSIEPYPQEISYGPSTIWLNTLTVLFGPYQYGQDYLDTTNSVSGDWWLNGEFQQANVPYFQNKVYRLGPEIISTWGLDDSVIIEAVAAHYGYTLLNV